MSPRLPITAPIRGVPHARKIFTIRRLSAFYQVGAALTLWVQLSFVRTEAYANPHSTGRATRAQTSKWNERIAARI